MAEVHSLKVAPRERAGKGAARAARRAGLVPAVIYGDKQPPSLIAIEPRDLTREIGKSAYYVTLFDIDGVLVTSWEPIDGAAEALKALESEDVRRCFLTNTTSRTRVQIAELLTAVLVWTVAAIWSTTD